MGNYFVFIPKRNTGRDEATHGYNYNVLLSKYPLLHAEEFLFPRTLGPGVPLESGICADIAIAGQNVRLYVCHLAIVGAGALTRMKQLRFLMSEARRHKGPVIVCGDMNAATPVNFISQYIIRFWHGWPRADMDLERMRTKVTEAALHHAEIVRSGLEELLDVTKPTWSPLRTAWFELFKLKLDWFCVKK